MILKLCLKLEDIDIKSHALWVVAFLTDTSDTILKKLLDLFEQKILLNIIELCLSPESSIKKPAIRILCNILAGDNQCIKVHI